MVVARRIHKLLNFHFAACAYSDGAKSLNDVVRAFKLRNGALPTEAKAHAGTLSDWFCELETEVFARYFQTESFSLRFRPLGEGYGGILSPDGYRAWAVTRDYLAMNNCLPEWPVEFAKTNG